MGGRRNAPRRKANQHLFERRTYLLIFKVVRYPASIQLLYVLFRDVILTIDVLSLDVAVTDSLLQMYMYGEMQQLIFLYLEVIGP